MKLFSFSKETTLVLKGIAVLMMVMLHLFNRAEYYSLCHSYLYIDGTPLINRIALACNPVGFFCFLSGFGNIIHAGTSKPKTKFSHMQAREYLNYTFLCGYCFSFLSLYVLLLIRNYIQAV